MRRASRSSSGRSHPRGTDSFGSELLDCCQECVDEIRAYNRSAEARTGECDWCHNDATDLRDRRDYEEGMYGRVYRVCGACSRRYDAEDVILAEAEQDQSAARARR